MSCTCNNIIQPIKIGAVEAILSDTVLEQKTVTGGLTYCDKSINVTWSPCQVTGWGRSPEQSIFYMKSLPYVSWYESKNNDLIANTYNTLARTVHPYKKNWADYGFRIKENATIGDPIPVHYTSNQNTTINTNFNRRFSYPSGYDYFQSEIYAISEGNTYPFLIEDWLTNPTETVVLGSPYSDFSSSDATSKYTGQIPTIPYWLRNYWLPSWTPKYPVISHYSSGDGHQNTIINNVYNYKMPYNCDTCKYDGTTGCCKINDFCEEDVPKTPCCLSGGLWEAGTCSTICPPCEEINSSTITVTFDNAIQYKDVEIHSSSPLCQWNAEESTDWFHINPTSGTSNSIRVTVQDNSNGQSRQGDITVTQDSITKIITIKQTGSNSNPTGACCNGNNCTETTFADCSYDFKEGSVCSSNPCDDGGVSAKDCCDYFIGPCCQWPSGCGYKTPQECRDENGIFLGFNQTCDNCPTYVPPYVIGTP